MSDAPSASPLEHVIEGYHHFVERNPIAHFVDTLLRGAGQVMFQNNPLTGFLFLLGIFWAEYMLPKGPPVGWGALIALVVSTATAMTLGIDRKSVTTGLYGFNATLVGIALPTFLQWSWGLFVYLILAAIINAIVMAAVTNVLATWGASAITFPFVLTTWFFLLAAFFFLHLTPLSLNPPTLPTHAEIDPLLRAGLSRATGDGLTLLNLIQSLLRGIAQVFLQDNLVTGIVFLIALLVSSRLAALYAIFGSAVGLITALLLGSDGYTIYHGLYGYNSVLGAIAIGSVFYVATWKSGLYAILCAILCAVVTATLLALLAPFGIPTLTAAFVFSTWLFVTPKKFLRHLEPTVRHAHTYRS